jgi:predicted DNA-binding protein with PD1-like motif
LLCVAVEFADDMKSKWINQNPKTLAIVFDSGDEAIAGLRRVAKEHNLSAASFTAIGAFQEVALGFFNFASKDYNKILIHEQVEVLSLLGDISLSEDGKPQVHAHVVVGKSDGTAHGGHLLSGIVRPTLEVVLIESPAHLQRKHDDETGLALIDLRSET